MMAIGSSAPAPALAAMPRRGTNKASSQAKKLRAGCAGAAEFPSALMALTRLASHG